jgi:hypothetical protein
VNELLADAARRSLSEARANNEARQRAARELKAAAEANAARERLTPLDDRLAWLLATIPVEVQREGLSLPALQVQLRGRGHDRCHIGELGGALRRAGFERRRNWHKNADGFRALWHKVS